ncbi:nuclease (SNase domain-containing protein) [Desulfofundulus kuznetsovii DSM 6115]|uniref:Nuclease (SNase domain-containing protein) n=1 Tax=Desulfofundulus kuznetsovii (strain DSM 6115 / VKM B-1805 / 17) TaxID=760568 RepID=A0AAU8PAI1_DESK7|nr:nuclease (SNase domain-containing protein) [Desulfofundulus kuznetsovii DSM 6115]
MFCLHAGEVNRGHRYTGVYSQVKADKGYLTFFLGRDDGDLKWHKSKILAVLLVTLMLLAVGCSGGTPDNGQIQDADGKVQKPPAQSQSVSPVEPGEKKVPAGLLAATVTRVVDGDTLVVRLKDGKSETVRLIGVNTPESTREVEPYGKEASAYTRSRLDGRRIWLERDVQERDHYGRILAYAWLEPPAGDKPGEDAVRSRMFNAELLLKGYAQVMTVPPNVKYADLFVRLQREAREKKRGLWGLEVKDREPYYIGNARSKKFHRPDCEYGRQTAPDNRVRFATKEKALDAGYEPCNACKP